MNKFNAVERNEGANKMTVETTYLKSGNDIVDKKYTDLETRDTFGLKEEELIRNEVINVLAKHNVPYWKAEVILDRAKVFLRKESVVQEIK